MLTQQNKLAMRSVPDPSSSCEGAGTQTSFLFPRFPFPFPEFECSNEIAYCSTYVHVHSDLDFGTNMLYEALITVTLFFLYSWPGVIAFISKIVMPGDMELNRGPLDGKSMKYRARIYFGLSHVVLEAQNFQYRCRDCRRSQINSSTTSTSELHKL